MKTLQQIKVIYIQHPSDIDHLFTCSVLKNFANLFKSTNQIFIYKVHNIRKNDSEVLPSTYIRVPIICHTTVHGMWSNMPVTYILFYSE